MKRKLPRRACFLVPHYGASGGIRHLLEYAAELSRRGWEIRVRCIGTWATVDVPRDPEDLRAWWGGFDTAELRYETGSIQSLRPRDGEILLTFGDAPNEIFLSSRWRGKPLVLIVLDWLAFNPARQRSYFRQPWSAVVCSTPYLRGELARERVSADVVGAGVDSESFYREPGSRAPRAVLGSLYSSIHNKGFEDTVELAERVFSAFGEPVELVTFGGEEFGPDPGAMPPGVVVSYTRHPTPDELRAIYNRSDVWLCTSRSEGFGFPSLEALACGVPVVSYRNGGESYFLRDDENGYVVDVLDLDTAADRVCSVLLDFELCARLSRAAIEEARRHTWEASTTALEKVLYRVLSS